MRCEICSASYCRDGELIKAYPFLKDYQFEEVTETNNYGNEYTNAYITINSIEDLFDIISKSNCINPNWGLILDGVDGEYSLQIYDGRVE